MCLAFMFSPSISFECILCSVLFVVYLRATISKCAAQTTIFHWDRSMFSSGLSRFGSCQNNYYNFFISFLFFLCFSYSLSFNFPFSECLHSGFTMKTRISSNRFNWDIHKFTLNSVNSIIQFVIFCSKSVFIEHSIRMMMMMMIVCWRLDVGIKCSKNFCCFVWIENSISCAWSSRLTNCFKGFEHVLSSQQIFWSGIFKKCKRTIKHDNQTLHFSPWK